MATTQELITQFDTDLGNDVTAMRTALSGKGVSATDTKLSGIAAKINAIVINTTTKYTGTVNVTYPTSWTSGTITCGSYSANCNGSGRATITVTQPGSYTVRNSHTSDSYNVTFYG